MNLKHLNFTGCPVCKAEVVMERRRDRHSNGQYNEVQQFACGGQVHWSPNHEAIMMASSGETIECPKSPHLVTRDAVRKVFLTRLCTGVGMNNELDSEFKDIVLSQIEMWKWRYAKGVN